MADTTIMKRVVEPFVRETLTDEYGAPFEARTLVLSSGGTHEFDAVSADGRVVAAIKSSSGKTAGGNIPSAKIRGVEADLYYLCLASAPHRLLVLTDPEFYNIILKALAGRIAAGISIKLITLPPEMQARVRRVQKIASDEVRRK